jgi:hypothetical protein
MIRRDYILRMIAEFLEVLRRIQNLKRSQLWQEARSTVHEQCRQLMGADALELAKLSETELLARLIQGEPTQVVRDKAFMLARLFQEAGDVAAGEDKLEESRALYLKGLHLLLYTLAEGEPAEWPEFLPRVDVFVTTLGEASVPFATQAALMQYYERTGQYGRAEDAFFRLQEAEPARPGLTEFGIAFYERLRGRPDVALAEGNLPRVEVEAGLAALKRQAGREIGG